jgi:Ca-activated chloride channel family protein
MELQKRLTCRARFWSMISIHLLIFVAFVPSGSVAQEEKKLIREGNKMYADGKFKEAEDQYRKSSEITPSNYKGAFNLGDAYYKQGKNKEAATKFEELTHVLLSDDHLKSEAFHNLGNALLKDKKYEESILAFKKALTLNPKDEDTRYNLAFAQEMLRQQQNKDKKSDKDNKDKKDNKNDKDKKNNKSDKDKKDKDNKDKKNDKSGEDQKSNKDNNKQEKIQQNQVSKGAAQKMLNEVNNNERKIQAKLKKQKEKDKAQSVIIEKDW